MRVRAYVDALRRRHRPVWFGSLGSTEPLSGSWGYDRGTPVDRWYIEQFLDEHRADVTGRVIEVKDSTYTDRYGHEVTERAVLDIDPANPHATHVADLASADSIPDHTFDCFILTQTLQLIRDPRAALRHVYRILRPGGVLLLTAPVTSRICDPPLTDYWRFTPLGMKALLEDVFGAESIAVEGRGNVLAQVAFLKGLAAEDLTRQEREVYDERFALIVCARAVRSA